MPGKKKRAVSRRAKRAGSSTALYFSLGAAAAAVTAALVTVLRRRNLTARASDSSVDLSREEDVSAPAPSLAANLPPPESAALPDEGGGPQTTEPKSDTSWSRPTKYVVGVGLFAAIAFAVLVARGSIKMIVLAALIAFVVRPIIDWLTRRSGMRRGAAIGIVYLVVIILLILIPFLVIPAVVEAINAISVGLYQHAAANMALAIDTLIQNVSANPALSGALIPLLESISSTLTQIAAGGVPPPLGLAADGAILTGALGIALGELAGILGPLISSIVSLVFALLISIQMTIAGDLFRNSGLNLVPAAYKPEIAALMDKVGHIWNSFMRGELLLMLVVGTFVWLGNWLIGTPYAFALGVIAGLLEVIPSLGPLLAWIPAVFLALVFGSTRFTSMDPLVFALLVSLLYGLIQGLENQVLVPQILGDAVNLPPVVVLIGVSIFGSLFGILGVLIATPTLATLSEIFGYLYGKILEGPAPPPDEENRSVLDNVRGFVSRLRLPWRRGSKPEPGSVETPVIPAGPTG